MKILSASLVLAIVLMFLLNTSISIASISPTTLSNKPLSIAEVNPELEFIMDSEFSRILALSSPFTQIRRDQTRSCGRGKPYGNCLPGPAAILLGFLFASPVVQEDERVYE